MEDWKQQHADEAEKLAKHKIVERILTNFASNMNFKREGLPEMGLWQIVNTVAQVVLAGAKGIDPDALLLSPEERKEQGYKMIGMMNKAGVKPIIISGRKPIDPMLN